MGTALEEARANAGQLQSEALRKGLYGKAVAVACDMGKEPEYGTYTGFRRHVYTDGAITVTEEFHRGKTAHVAIEAGGRKVFEAWPGVHNPDVSVYFPGDDWESRLDALYISVQAKDDKKEMERLASSFPV